MNLKELSKHIRIRKSDICFVLVFTFLLLFPFPTGGDRFFWGDFFDAGHPIIFFTCTLMIYRIYLPSVEKSRRRVIIECGALSFLFAALIELIQPIFNRSASLHDLTLGALGIIPACFMLSPFPVLIIIGPIMLFFVQSIAFKPVSLAMEAIKWRKENFPLLLDFEDDIQFRLIKGTYFLQEQNNNRFIRAYQPVDTYSYIRYEAGDKDWTTHKLLSFDIFNPINETTTISIRIDDDQDCEEVGKRFVQTFELKPGWNNITFPTIDIQETPKLRKLNLNKIRYLYFYVEQSITWFGIDNVKLIL